MSDCEGRSIETVSRRNTDQRINDTSDENLRSDTSSTELFSNIFHLNRLLLLLPHNFLSGAVLHDSPCLDADLINS